MSGNHEHMDIITGMSQQPMFKEHLRIRMKAHQYCVGSLTSYEKQYLGEKGYRLAENGYDVFHDDMNKLCDSSSNSDTGSDSVDTEADIDDERLDSWAQTKSGTVSFSDDTILRKMNSEQVTAFNIWLSEYRKCFISFSGVRHTLQEFSKLTSDKNHPYHNEGLFIRNFQDNKVNVKSNWFDDNNKYFESFFANEIPLFATVLKFDHHDYIVPFCEYDSGQNYIGVNKAEHFKKADSGIWDSFRCMRAELPKAFEIKSTQQTMMSVLEGVMGEKEAEARTEDVVKRTKNIIRTCEANMFAAKRLMVWTHGMMKKEEILKKLMHSTLKKYECVETRTSLSPFEKTMLEVHIEADDNPTPMGMSPLFMVWIEILNHSLVKRDVEFGNFFKSVYPELAGVDDEYKMLAKKHVYQYHVRYDLFTPQMLVAYFLMDVEIKRAEYDNVTRFLNESKYHVRQALFLMKQFGKFEGRQRFIKWYQETTFKSSENFSLPDACTMCWGVDGLTLKACKFCETLYCSQKCSSRGWKSHKTVCPGGSSVSSPQLIDTNKKFRKSDTKKRANEYLCDPTKKYIMFTTFPTDVDVLPPVQAAKPKKKFNAVKKKSSGKKKAVTRRR